MRRPIKLFGDFAAALSAAAACARHKGRALGLLLIAGLLQPPPAAAAEYRPLPPAPPTGLSSDWLIHDAARNRLILFLADYHAPAHAYYQYVTVRRTEPFPLAFVAERGLSVFLDNQLLFVAPTPGPYALDLARLLPAGLPNGAHLLAVWQPGGSPALASFSASGAAPAARPGPAAPTAGPVAPGQYAQARPPAPQGQNTYLGLLLLLGLLYGGLRNAFQSGLARVFQFEELFAASSEQQSFLLKPAFSTVNLALVLLFSLSFALLLTAMHTELQPLPLLRRFLYVPETAVVARVLLYTALVAAYILGKYLFLELMGYSFDLQELVTVHYREFLRTTLLASLLVPLVLLAYLSLSPRYPLAMAWAVDAVTGLVLVATALRVARTLHQKASLLNLHLFAYLCATEVLPLLVLLRLLVFAN